MSHDRTPAQPESGEGAAVPERMATDLLRMARHPANGRVRRGGSLDIALRAGLLCDLVLAGRITSDGHGPLLVEGSVSDTGDRISDALARTIGNRPNVAWWRWFRHVHVDRVALSAELVDSGVWTRAGGIGKLAGYEDIDPAYGPALGFELDALLQSQDASDLRRSLLAMLKHLSGADGSSARPRALRRDLKAYSQQVMSGGPNAQAAMAAVAGCTVLMRRPTRR